MSAQLRPGYKRTEVGVIPEEWEVQRLSTISERIMVGIASAATHAYRNSGVPLLRNQNIKAGYLDDGEILYVDPTYERTFRNKRLREGDLLTARTGYPGMTCVVPGRYDSAQSFTTLITRPILRVADSAYLCYFINSGAGRRFFDQSQIGGAQKNVNAGALRRMPIPVPAIRAQRAIAEVLGDVDALLGTLARLIAKKRDLKQAAMQRLLTGLTCLPGCSGKWEVKRLGAFGKCLRGVSYRGETDLSPYDTGTTIRLLRANNVQSATVVVNDVQFVNEERVSDAQVLVRDDIVICMANGSKDLVGKAARFNLDDGHAYTFGAFMGCFRIVRRLAHPGFVSLLFQTARYRDHIANLIAGSSINNLRPIDIESLQFRVPDDEEQTAIASVLSDMDAEIAALESRLAKTRALKQGMMQELLTGNTRLI